MRAIDKSAFEIEEADDLIAQGDQIAANDVTVNTSQADRAMGWTEAAGKMITDRIGAKDTVSALQAKDLQNQAANYRFAPGTSLDERLRGAAALSAKTAMAGANLVEEEGKKRAAMGAFAKQANLATKVKLREYEARAEATNLETDLAVKQGTQAMRLAQTTLDNQYKALSLHSQNAQQQMQLDAKRADINFAFQVAGASLSTIANLSATAAQQAQANKAQFKQDAMDLYAAGGLSQEQLKTSLAYKPGFFEQLSGNIDPFKK